MQAAAMGKLTIDMIYSVCILPDVQDTQYFRWDIVSGTRKAVEEKQLSCSMTRYRGLVRILNGISKY